MISEDIEKYCVEHSTRPGDVVRELGEYTKNGVHGSNMLIGDMEASVLAFLIKLVKVKKIHELGTCTGYSALAMDEHLPSNGSVITVDIVARIAQSA